MYDIVRVFNRLQPVLHRSQGSREFTSGGNHQTSQILCDSSGGQVAGFWPDLLPERLGTVFPVVLTLIGGTFKRLGERLRGFLQPFLWKRANCRSEFLYGVSLGRAQCCVGEEGRELLAVLAKINWGIRFLEVNQEPLDLYAAAKDSAEVVAIQATYLV